MNADGHGSDGERVAMVPREDLVLTIAGRSSRKVPFRHARLDLFVQNKAALNANMFAFDLEEQAIRGALRGQGIGTDRVFTIENSASPGLGGATLFTVYVETP